MGISPTSIPFDSFFEKILLKLSIKVDTSSAVGILMPSHGEFSRVLYGPYSVLLLKLGWLGSVPWNDFDEPGLTKISVVSSPSIIACRKLAG